jgi:mono/diheme cytochrome c family protein
LKNSHLSTFVWKIYGFCVLVFIAGFLATGCRDSAPPTESPVSPAQNDQNTVNGQEPGEDQQLLLGQTIFEQMCATCHGSRGSGRGTRSGPALRHDDYVYGTSFEAIQSSIAEGRPGGMPFFHHVLSDEEIEAVTLYVLSLIP